MTNEQKARKWAENSWEEAKRFPSDVLQLNQHIERAYLAGMEEAQRWVSVEERLPDPYDEDAPLGNRVLAMVVGHKYPLVMCRDWIDDDDYKLGGWYAWCNCYDSINGDPIFDDNYQVTEWRYILPQPPKPAQ